MNIGQDPMWLERTVKMAREAAETLDLDSKDAWDKIKNWLHHISTLQNYASKDLSTANMLHSYGLAALFFGFNALALDLYSAALDVKEIYYKDENNIELNTTLNNLGYVELALGNYTKAKKFLNRALKILELHYNDPTDYNLYSTLSNLGAIELYYGNYDLSQKLHERALTGIQKYRKNIKHIDLYYPLNNLGLMEFFKGNYQQAKKIFLRAYEILEKHYQNTHHIEFAYPLYNLGLTEAALGDYDISLNYLTRGCEIYNKHYGERLQANMLFVYSPIIPWYKLNLVNRDKAIKYYQDSLIIVKKTFGEQHHLVAQHHYLLGQAFEVNGYMKNAISQYQDSLGLARQIFNGISEQD